MSVDGNLRHFQCCHPKPKFGRCAHARVLCRKGLLYILTWIFLCHNFNTIILHFIETSFWIFLFSTSVSCLNFYPIWLPTSSFIKIKNKHIHMLFITIALFNYYNYTLQAQNSFKTPLLSLFII